jgi:SAM-dependent methyltransferase
MMQSGSALLGEVASLIDSGRYVAALNTLRDRLARIRGEGTCSEWRTFCGQTFSTREFSLHPVSRLIVLGPLGQACAAAARGALHHPFALDAIYGLDRTPEDLSSAAYAVRQWELELGFCASLRERYFLLARELNELGTLVRYPRVLAFGCGYLREAASALSLEGMRGGEVIAVDRDRGCLALIEREYEYPGLRTMCGPFRDLMASDKSLGKFDFIYLPTLFDSREDDRIRALLPLLRSRREPGGRLVAANFAPDLPDAAYLEACLDWWPQYRDEQALATLIGQLPGISLRGQIITRENSGGSVILDLQAE